MILQPQMMKMCHDFLYSRPFPKYCCCCCCCCESGTPFISAGRWCKRIFWSCKCSLEDYSGMSLTCHMSSFIKSFRISRPKPFDFERAFKDLVENASARMLSKARNMELSTFLRLSALWTWCNMFFCLIMIRSKPSKVKTNWTSGKNNSVAFYHDFSWFC